MLHESEESSFRIPSNTRPDIPREGQHGDHHGVVCCNPEKLRDKLWCKGGGSIKSIEIKLPPAKRASPPREPTGKQESPPPTAGLLAGYCCTECYHGQRGGPCYFGVPPPPPCFWTYGRPVYDRSGIFSSTITARDGGQAQGLLFIRKNLFLFSILWLLFFFLCPSIYKSSSHLPILPCQNPNTLFPFSLVKLISKKCLICDIELGGI
ncbi:uncharacterized protein [Gossypium hirsutum]|uniref:Uncharacterized protein isoform X3 n=1 Tax=Gossypium hirsutum TaxID=3635 RepID=A0ABM3A4X7_GOSHI|nr:uncharacterized protein LOC121217768 isoform X3 [Gossypium hirsutum]XP_040949923.1 uncharacterized protein LOC121217768 isoform X3 [Gossypium hirsutum]